MSPVSADPPNARRSSGSDDVAVGQPGGDPVRRLELDAMALIIIHRQRDHGEVLLPRQPGADHRIKPAREKHDRGRAQSFSPSRGAAQNIIA